MSGEAARRPLYARVLRLRYLHPGGMLCFVFFEGMILLAILLALAELVTWWVVIILPASVAAMVKINDMIAGLTFPYPGEKTVLPRRVPEVARGSATVGPAGPGSAPPPAHPAVGRAVGRAVATASTPGVPGGARPAEASGRPENAGSPPEGVRGPGGGPPPGRTGRPGEPAAAAGARGPVDDSVDDPGRDSGDRPGGLGQDAPPRRTIWPNQRRFERPV